MTLIYTDNAEVPIPELGQSHYTERTITIPDEYDGTISNLILDLDITHPAGYDIRVELESPDGTNIRIVNYDTSAIIEPWDEEPFELDDWNGEMTAGVWTLKINDGFANVDEGTLHSWELRIDTDEDLDNSGTTPAATVPDAPTGLAATQTHEEVTLTWTDPNDDTITGYKIYRDGVELVADTASTTLEYVDDTVEADTEYVYKIAAINDEGTSDDSSEVTITTDEEPVVVSDGALTGFTEVSTGYSIDLDDTNVRGLCLWNDIWRVGNGSDIKAFTNTFAADTDNDITLSGLTTGENVRGLTTDGTNLIALTRNDAGEYRLRFITSSGGITATVLLSIPTGYPQAPSIAYDLDNSEIWIAWIPAAHNEASLFKSYSSSGVELTGASASFTGNSVNSRPTGMVWWNGYLITTNRSTSASDYIFFVYNLFDNSQVTIPAYSIISSSALGKKDNTVYVLERGGGTSAEVSDWTIIFTEEEDTTAPTFQVDDNTTDFATTVAFEGTYTVGVISDISETGTTSTITGDSNVNTSTAGEYTVTYTVTDAAGNAGEIVETVTVSPEVIVPDTTAPTFTVKDNSADFDIMIELGAVYNVGTFDDIIDEDASPSEDIVYKNSSGNIITSFDGDELAIGTYSVEYTLTDDAGNISITIIESITVEDTTAPTFLVDTRSADFNTAVTNGNTYTVGIIGSIVDESTYSTNIDGDDDVDTSTDGEYTVTYTVTDASSNVGTIVETVTVSSTPDTTAPTITSAVPEDNTLVNSINAEWLVTFSEDVQDVGTVDFFISKNGIANFTPDSIEIVSASQYRLFAELPSAGIYNLRIRGNSDISDLSDNEITQSGQISNSTITYTDTIAPTFNVKGYTDDFTINIITGGTYTVGTIDDIVEVNVYNELISGASSVDTSTEGDYEVEYSVTDVNNNEKMIIETVTVADELVAVAGTLDFTFKYEIQKSTTTIANPNPMIVSSDKAVVK